jgi:aspartyl-tRNA(Asn)/glutamyl-tRNA(Gln) amidotransferase subunit C
MTITQQTVDHVAKLARLELTPDEVARYTQDLGKILTLVEQLNEVDLSQVDVGMSVDEPTVFRADHGIREFSREELLKNAPCEEDGFFRVPKILSDSSAG